MRPTLILSPFQVILVRVAAVHDRSSVVTSRLMTDIFAIQGCGPPQKPATSSRLIVLRRLAKKKTAMGFDVVFSGENLLKAIEARKMKNSLRAEGKDIPEQGRSRPRIATR